MKRMCSSVYQVTTRPKKRYPIIWSKSSLALSMQTQVHCKCYTQYHGLNRTYISASPGLLNLRQIFFAMYDMLLHTDKHNYSLPRHSNNGRIDTGALWAQLRKEITWIDQPPNTNPAASYGHIMGGYDAQYYVYKYAEVFSADMFSLFKVCAPTSGSLRHTLNYFCL